MNTHTRQGTDTPRTAGRSTAGQRLSFNSALQQAYDELTLSEKRYKDLYDNAPDMYHTLDLEGNFLEFNPRHLEKLGYEFEELEGQNVAKIFDERSLERFPALFQKMMTDGHINGPEFELIRKDGSLMPVEISAVVDYGPDGQPHEVRCIMRDLTERKLLEDELRQAQKMESVGRLAGGMAHDMNNMLTALMSHAQLGIQELSPGSQACEDIQEVLNTSERAASLIQQLLAFSRRQVIEPKVVDLNALVLNLDKMMRRLVPENIELVLELEKKPAPVTVDPNQMEQVLLNLVVNSCDAISKNGRIAINTANVTIHQDSLDAPAELEPGPYLMLSVIDNGSGMSEEVREHIFEPFFTTKGEGKGTGLGLATCYGTVKQNSGHITVSSGPGSGTRFDLYFPRTDSKPAPIKTEKHRNGWAAGDETILLVEDDTSVRHLIARVLSGAGYNVIQAEDGKEGLELSQAYDGEIHLLFTDLLMPGLDVQEFVDQMKGQRKGIKVLFTSGYLEDVISNNGVLKPGIEFLQKPFLPPEVCEKVRRVLDH